MRSQDRPELKPLRNPAEWEIVFAAGFYEGEGSVFRPKKNSGMAVVCGQADPEILYRLRDVFGGSVHKQTASRSSWQNGFIYRWLIGGDRARNFMRLVFPYLSTRRKQQAIAASFNPESVTTARLPLNSDDPVWTARELAESRRNDETVQ